MAKVNKPPRAEKWRKSLTSTPPKEDREKTAAINALVDDIIKKTGKTVWKKK